MAEKTGKRKVEHIRICLDEKAQAKKTTSGFEDIQLIHRALPEIDKIQISLQTTFLNKKFNAPIIVGAMTGGTEEATEINGTIAETVEKLGLGMGLGSQRAAIENKNLEKTYSIARKKAPHAFLVANIGGVQLVHGYGVKEVKRIIEMIDADAVAIHLNALQETVQPEGQTNFKGILEKIVEISDTIDQPVIVKETGAGICAEDAKILETAGIKALDIGGAGGTSFAAVEYYRVAPKTGDPSFLGESLWDWGIPTATSLIETAQTIKLPLIATGGVRSGTDIAKALALGANLASIVQPILQTAIQGRDKTEQKLQGLIEELRTVMFLLGAQEISDLSKIPVVIRGKTAEWLTARGFSLQKYAKRGTDQVGY
ncbi:MAG: type 2 isopentenyl-diphosphate Delta-isomerase [Nitrososphaerota archaeon]|jgi:isopentenyl-diphosphate delta-isomerase|nr:type 2 isopentenyl-diphosphate Delta-isomerase [Nitrososphaerota archaeon]